MKKTPSYAAAAADIGWRYWPLWAFASAVLIGAVIFAGYLTNRANLADQRNERQRAAICAILANIPGQVPTEIQHARVVFANRPGDCNPIKGATPKPEPIHVTINGKPGVIVVNPPRQTTVTERTPSPRPSPSPQPSPSPRPTHSSSPSPSPCPLVAHVLHRC